MVEARLAKERFLALLDLPVARRAEALAALEREDRELARRVRSLLAAHDSDAGLLDEGPPVAALGGGTAAELSPGTRVGPFELEALLGEGGFAQVFRARQLEPVVRAVALKVLRPGMDSERVVARFEAERQALALMDHPGIARVFDGGATVGGRPWFAMELVEGPTLTEYARRHELDVPARVSLVLATCRAVQHAHQKGVVHRDLKPSNVLMGEVDGEPLPKVIDFGIAKAIEQPLLGDATVTLEGQLVGTPAYMAPEQATAGAPVDTRCDVYALGVLLYELLTGQRPFEEHTLRDLALDEALRVVREVEPPRPSVRRAQDDPAAARALRGDLDWIVMCCLEKDPERRYDAVGVLANDLQRHLTGLPVLAGPPDLSYRASRFVRRHRFVLGAAGLLLAVLIGAVVVSTTQLGRALRAERELSAEVLETELQLDRFQEISGFYEGVLMGLDPAFAREQDTTLLRRVLEDAEQRLAQQVDRSPIVEATVRRAVGGAYNALGLAAEAEVQQRLALTLRDEHLDAGHPDRLQSLHELGTLLTGLGRVDEAGPLLEEAAERRAAVLGAGHVESLRSRANLGVLRRHQGRLEEAVLLLDAVVAELAAQQRLVTPEGIRCLNNLGGVLWDLDRRGVALEIYRQALDAQLELHDEQHPDTLKALNNLGHALAEEGALDEALPLLRRALEAKQRVLPAGHPSLLIGWNNLATLQERGARPEDALGSYVAALQSASEGGTLLSPTALKLRRNLGVFLQRLGQLDEALAQHAEAAAGARRGLGPDDALTIQLDGEHGWLLAEVGRPAEAEPVLTSALARAREQLGADDPLGAAHGVRLGLVVLRLGRDDEARELLELHLPTARRAPLGDLAVRAEVALEELRADG